MPKTIFFVEDEKLLVDTLSAFLREKGFIIEAAHNGEEALRNIAAVRPDLILLDIVLPEMSGIDFLRQIQKPESEFANIPVLVLSNLQGDDESFQKLGLKIEGYLVKANFKLEDVGKKIIEILEKK